MIPRKDLRICYLNLDLITIATAHKDRQALNNVVLQVYERVASIIAMETENSSLTRPPE